MTDHTKLVVNGHNITVVCDTTYRQPKATRLYAWGTSPDYDHPPFSIKGDDPDNDKAWRKYNRDEITEMRKLLEDVTVFLNDIANGDLTYRFSRKAGCGCGCSPGFIADRALFLNGRPIVQISVEK